MYLRRQYSSISFDKLDRIGNEAIFSHAAMAFPFADHALFANRMMRVLPSIGADLITVPAEERPPGHLLRFRQFHQFQQCRRDVSEAAVRDQRAIAGAGQ